MVRRVVEARLFPRRDLLETHQTRVVRLSQAGEVGGSLSVRSSQAR